MSVETLYQETVRSLIITGAERWPERKTFDFPDGTSWTRSQTLDEAAGAANRLNDLGIAQGDFVALFMDNGQDLVRAWLGIAMAGAVVVPMNVAYRGQVLADLCERIRPSLIVVEDHYRTRFDGLELRETRLAAPSDLRGEDHSVHDLQVDPWDLHAILLTSGTTGGSKGSLTTNAHMNYIASYLVHPRAGLDGSDVFLADLPFCHLSSLAPTVQMLRAGGRITVRERPDLSNYWATAKSCGATFSMLAGTMAEFIARLPPSEHDRDHPMRMILASPLPSDPQAFTERFGVGLMTAYGLTEGSIVCIKFPDEDIPPGSCGRAREEVELRIVDAHDREVPTGETGEMTIRNRLPWVTTQGYVNDPVATAAAWRNNWIHTGDMLHVDADGFYFFHDRSKDSLRRRGENISSVEVEREVLAYHAVSEVACVASVQDVVGDDEVKVFIVPEPGVSIDFVDLIEFLADRMPHYMVPRFVELIDEFPKTPSSRIRKFELKAMGNTDRTWDREAEGIRVTRGGLVKQP